MSDSVQLIAFRGSATEWDAFAARCGASFRCSARALSLWQFDHHWIHRMRRLELHLTCAGGTIKIGQCAVGVGRTLRVFADSLQLLPEHAGLWPQAMGALLHHLGPGTYHYGSQWNLEAPREADFGAVPGVKVEHVEPITLDVVEFRQWSSWDAYFRKISSNAKRNAKRAQESFPDLSIGLRSGSASLRSWSGLFRVKTQLAQRKKLGLSGLRSLLRYGMRVLALRDGAFTALVECGGRPMAGFSGIDFGPNTYFLEGASCDGNTGTNWHLLLGMLERAFGRDPQGHFVMGAQYASQPRDEGLAFSRRQVRVSLMPTSEVRFNYQPPALRLVAGAGPAPAMREVVEDFAAAARIGSGLPRGA